MQPTANKTAAGDGGEIVELAEHALSGQDLQYAQAERGAADAAAGQT